jgi:hypothetical protein
LQAIRPHSRKDADNVATAWTASEIFLKNSSPVSGVLG